MYCTPAAAHRIATRKGRQRGRGVWLGLLCLAIIAASATPPEAMAEEEADFGSDRESVAQHPAFGCVLSELQQVVDFHGGPGWHDLYLSPVGYNAHDGSQFLRVYWPRAKAILLQSSLERLDDCEQPQPPMDKAGMLYMVTKLMIDLRKEVVPTQEDIHGSTYLVSRPWTEQVIEDARRNGYHLRLRHRRWKQPEY